mmetsp:Transcript_33749/g.34384  ORF Transcript_33749/g.34384 Transcript_33749/m.34384 type:complete len:203 (+) Transcript_33749:29-637(+)
MLSRKVLLVLVTQVMIFSTALRFSSLNKFGKCGGRGRNPLPFFRLKRDNGVSRFSSTRLLSTTKIDEINDKEIAQKKAMSIGEKAKFLWNNYGYVAVGTYFGLYITTLSSIYGCLDYDIFNAAAFGLDPAHAVQKVCDIVEAISGYTTFPDYVRHHPQLGTLAVAWVMTKITEPARVVFTIFVVPKISSAIGYKSNSKSESV